MTCRMCQLAVTAVLFQAGQVRAAGPASAQESAVHDAGLTSVDWLIVLAYAVSTVALGWYYSRRQESTQEYFIGSGNLNPLVVGVSLFATLLSTISYLSMPGEAAGKGPVNMLGLLAYPIIFPIVAFVFIPVYMRQRATSAYELLELRLGLSLRLLGAGLFLALRLVWMTLLVYLAASAMSVMLGVDYWILHFDTWTVESATFDGAGEFAGLVHWNGSRLLLASVPVIVAVTGMVSVTYTTLGGLRAVVVTDVMQTILLFGGAVLVVVLVSWRLDGFAWFPTSWHHNWDTQPLYSFDPRTRVSVLGTVISIATWYVATSAGDQASVQRFMATRDAAAARRALATQLCVGGTIVLTLHVVGFALLGFFEANPERLPVGLNLKADADKLFPRFISYELPVGVSGLVVAAMFAAAMSSIDSGVNSITAVVSTDFLQRFRLSPQTSVGSLRFNRLLALAIGVIVVVGSAYIKFIPGNITAVTNKTASLFTTSIFALFVFAFFVPWARPAGVWIAAIFGTLTAAAIAFSGPLVVFAATYLHFDPAAVGVELLSQVDPATGTRYFVSAVREWNAQTQSFELQPRDPVSYQWINPVALTVNLCTGIAISAIITCFKRDS